MKSRKAMVASVLALTGLALAGSACVSENTMGALATARADAIAAESADALDPPAPTTVPRDSWVLYEVTGDANGVSIAMVNETGGIDQGDYVLPFRNTAYFPHDMPILSISARIIDPIQGVPQIVCRIAVIEYTGSMLEIRSAMLELDDAMQLKGSLLEFGRGSAAFDLALKVEAEASSFGNSATCLW